MTAKRSRARTKARKSRKDPAARERAIEVLHPMRNRGISLKQAAREAHTTPATVRKYAGSALKRMPNGRYVAAPSDRLTRHVWLLTKDGNEPVAVRGSRQAERVASHWAAVDWYLKTGDASRLAAFRGKGIRSGNRFFPFLTDTKVLDRLAHANEVSFERLYTRRA